MKFTKTIILILSILQGLNQANAPPSEECGKSYCTECSTNTGRCIGCADEWFHDNPSKSCKACSDGCQYCTSSTFCTTCKSLYTKASDGMSCTSMLNLVYIFGGIAAVLIICCLLTCIAQYIKNKEESAKKKEEQRERIERLRERERQAEEERRRWQAEEDRLNNQPSRTNQIVPTENRNVNIAQHLPMNNYSGARPGIMRPNGNPFVPQIYPSAMNSNKPNPGESLGPEIMDIHIPGKTLDNQEYAKGGGDGTAREQYELCWWNLRNSG